MKKGYLFIVFFLSLSFVSATLNVSLSDQGTNAKYKSNGSVINSGDLEVTIYDEATGGNLIYNETFAGVINNGSWNVMLGENSSNHLSLEFGKLYYKDYKINGQDLDFIDFYGNSVERRFFYSPLGDIGGEDISQIANLTTTGFGKFAWINTTETSYLQDVDFNEGWLNNGVSIINGNIFAQTIYVYNISSLNVNNLVINGSSFPSFDDVFDIGNSTMRWQDLFLSGQVYSNGTGNNYFLGNLGIGTTSPSQSLDVRGQGNFSGTVYVNNGTSILSIMTPNASYWNRTIGNVFLQFPGDKVGIGTSTPSNLLEVAGDLMVYDEIKQSSNQSIINRIINSGNKQIFTSISDGFSQGAVPINTWMTPVMTNYSHGYGNISFDGGVFDGQNIWLVPRNSTYLVKVNPATGQMTNYSAGGYKTYGESAFSGGVFDGQNIWLVPDDSLKLVKVNPATGQMTNYSADYDEGDSFWGGVFDGSNIWLIPWYSTKLVKVNPATGVMTNYSVGYGNYQFSGGVFDGQNIWLVPDDSLKLVKVNPATGVMTNYSADYGTDQFTGAVFDGQNIWLIPDNSDYLVKVNPATGVMTNYSHGYGDGAFYGGVFDGQSILLVPANSLKLVKVNPATGQMTNYSADYGNYPFAGGVFDGSNIWLVPQDSTKLVKVRPQEFGLEGLYTGGALNVGGSMNVNNTLFVNSSNVGIGISTPSQTLEVAGNINVSKGGNITIGGIMQLQRFSVLPACGTLYNGSLATNLSGLYYCNSTQAWNMIASG